MPLTINSPEVKARLEALAEANEGLLRPEAVIDDAKDEASPLNPLFEWDDELAAHIQRVDRAREIIRTVTVTYRVEDRIFKAPVWVHDPTLQEGEQGYVALVAVQSDEDKALRVINRELDAVQGHLERAMAMAEVLGLRSELSGLLVSVTAFRQAMADAQQAAA